MQYLIGFLYLAIPIGALAFFAISLWQYLRVKKRVKQQPDSIPLVKLKALKIRLIISSLIAGCLAVIVIGFIALLFMAVAFM